MRQIFRYRLRTLFVTVTVVAVLLGLIPHYWRQWRINAALEATVANGPDQLWGYDPLASERANDYEVLLSDRDRVLDRLAEIARTDTERRRRANALNAMVDLSEWADSHEARQRILPHLIDFACDPNTPAALGADFAKVIANWTPTTGVTIEQRSRILRTAERSELPARLAWIAVLDAVGGRKETELLLEFGDTHDEDQLWAVHNSVFRSVTWHGMLPAVRRWLKDTTTVETAVEFSVLSQTPSGRVLLVELVADVSQPAKTRAKAVEQLVWNEAGIQLLYSACRDEAVARGLSAVLGEDCREKLVADLDAVRSRNGDQLWDELIYGLDADYWAPTDGRMTSGLAGTELVEFRKQQAKAALAAIRALSGEDSLTTAGEWRLWRESTSPGVVELRMLLQSVIDNPEIANCGVVFRRLFPHHLGYVPGDCLSLYRKLLQSGEQRLQYCACHVLLEYTDSREAVDTAIDLIARSKPSDSTRTHSAEILMLRRRFAVNFFWDVEAWRRWADTLDGSEGQPPGENANSSLP